MSFSATTAAGILHIECADGQFSLPTDIAANLTDEMFQGKYHGKQAHAPDLTNVLSRAWDAGENAPSRDMELLVVNHRALPFRLGTLGIV